MVGATLYWNNAFNAGGIPGGGLGDFPILATTSPFVNAAGGNFYPAATSPLIDSSVPNLADRTTFVDTKTPHALGVFDPATGRYSSQIVAPTTDVTGQLRVDDPAVNTPPAQAKQSIIDRGAIDRADLFAPTAKLLTPLDNDVEGRDRDPNATVVHVYDNTLTSFQILLADGNGMGIDSSSVTSRGVTLTQNGVLLTDGVQYTFGFNATANQILLTTLSEIWEPNAVYQITLNNRDRTAIEARDGSQVADGNIFTITDAGGTAVTFEYESGYSLQLPRTTVLQIRSAGTALDGATLTVNDGMGNRTLEFDLGGDGVSNPMRIAVPYLATDDLDDIAEQLIAVIDSLAGTVGDAQYGLSLHPRSLGGGAVHLGTSSAHTNVAVSGALSTTGVTAGVEEGQTFLMDWQGTTYQFEFDSGDGVTLAGNIPVAFSWFDTYEDLAENVAAAIRGQAGLGLTTASHVGGGLVHVGGQPGLTINVTGSPLSRLGRPGLTTGTVAVNYVPSAGFGAELMAGAIINAINAAPFNATATVRAGSSLFVQGISGASAVNDVDGTLRSVFDVVGIKDRAGNSLAANQSSAETQFTIILGDVAIDFGDLPNDYKTVLASNGARHILLSGTSYLGVAVDADPDGRPGVRADGDDGDAWLDSGTSGLVTVPTGPHTIQAPVNGAAGLTDNASSFTVTDADGLAVTFVFDLNGAGGVPVGTQPLTYFATDSADILVGRMIDAIAAEVGEGTLRGVAAVTADGGTLRIDGAASVTAAAALGLTLLNRLPAAVTVPAGPFGAANDGKTLTVHDGVNSLTFEFEETNTVNNGLTDLSHYAVQFDSASATGESVAAGIQAAIENAVAEGRLENLLVTVDATQVRIAHAQENGAAGDDEDGVTYLGIFNRFTTSTQLIVTASGPGLLDAWVDFNRNLRFDATEQIFSSVPVLEGQNYLSVVTPSWATAGTTYAPLPLEFVRPSVAGGFGAGRRDRRLHGDDHQRPAARGQRRHVSGGRG